MKWLYFTTILILLLSSCREIKVEKSKLLASDYRLFQDTPAWELAKAVEDNNIYKIRNIIKKDPSIINYQEPIHHKTILMQACYHHDYNSFEQLLKLGANVNLYDKVNGASAIIIACRYNAGDKYVKQLLEYGANPNDIEVGERRAGNNTRYTPLRGAVENGNIETVKLLLQAGADVNYYDEFGTCALKQAAYLDYNKIVLLLIKNNAYYDRPISKNRLGPIYLVNVLRLQLFPIGSIEHSEKMQVIDFLQRHGIDYRNTPIPEFTLQRIKELYPDTWEEYIEKY